MADYKAEQVAGSSWQRCYRVTIQNNRGAIPSVTFDEQRITLLGDREIAENVDSCSDTFNPSSVIEIRNPNTGEKTGQTITQAELYAIVYSLYIQAAKARDARA